MECIDFFSEHIENKEKCKELQKLPYSKLIEWECETASQHSPGPVDDKEILCRQIISPIHYDEEANALTAAAFDDVANKGLSVNRLSYTSNSDITRNAENRVENHNQHNSEEKKRRTFIGILQFNCIEIRSITVNVNVLTPVRGLAVFDTASEGDQSHADICQIVKGRAEGRSLRHSIMDLANSFLANNPFQNNHSSNS